MMRALHGVIASSYRSSGGRFIDTFGAPIAAFSLRLLSSSYSGDCIRVRRSSDNAEQDIGFASGVLDESALTTFVGANDGFIVTWYDQSGNANDASEATTGYQPQIVSSGTVLTALGLPTSKRRTSMDGLLIPNTTGLSSFTVLAVADTTLVGASSRILTSYLGSGSLGNEIVIQFNGTNDQNQAGTKVVNISGSGGDRLMFAYRDSTTEIGLSVNGVSPTTTASPSGSNARELRMFEEGGTVLTEACTSISECIIYGSNQNANRADMLSEVNGYYGVY